MNWRLIFLLQALYAVFVVGFVIYKRVRPIREENDKYESSK